MEFDVFLSYSTHDLKQIESLRAELASTPIRIFVAEDSIQGGERLKEKIEAAIRKCDMFVVVWSKNARESKWVQQEIGQAQALRKTIVPLVIDETEGPGGFVDDVKYLRFDQNRPEDLSIAKRIITTAYHEKLEKTSREIEQRKQKETESKVMLGTAAFLFWIATRKS